MLVVSVTVTFSTTAETPVDGTPPTPVTLSCRVWSEPIGAPVVRVSRRRDVDTERKAPGFIPAGFGEVTVIFPVTGRVPSIEDTTVPVPSTASAFSVYVYEPAGTDLPDPSRPFQDRPRIEPSADAAVARVRTTAPPVFEISTVPALRGLVAPHSTVHATASEKSAVGLANAPSTRGADVDSDEKSRQIRSVVDA